MHINDLKKEHEIIEIFCDLAQIPSPSLKENNVINWVKNFCTTNNIAYKTDGYNNIIITVNGTNPLKKPVLLSAHMDVVGDDSPVIATLDGDYIHAQYRTLGADDKVGVASILLLAKELSGGGYNHGGLEIVLTRDEECGMSGIEHIDFTQLKSKYVLVCDADKLGQLLVSGASYTNGALKVKAFYGGHSGIDIADKTKPNAAKLLAELVAKLPQGVFYSDETGVITSINIGGIKAGNIDVTNVLNTEGEASYSIRSASVKKEEELKTQMTKTVADFNKKYEGIAEAKLTFSQHLPPFEKADDDYIEKIFIKVCKHLKIKPEVASFHAGAETHIYAHQKNSQGETFVPFLIGLADVYNMHSSDEKVDYKSMLKGYELLKELFCEYSR